MIYAIALLNCLSLTEIANSQTITQLSFYSSISIFDMKYINNHLVVSQNGLLVFDVTNPSRIALVGQASFPDGVAHSIAAQGNYAYMAEGNNGLFAVYNISNFNAPHLTGSVSIPNASGGLVPHGNYVYITGIDSVFVVDVSNPSSPQVIKKVFMPQAGVAGGGAIRIDGHSLFIMTTSSLKVFDISNPANPVFTTSVAFSHYLEQGLSADTVNHRLFLPWITPVDPQFMGYDAYDVSNPSSPVFLFRDSTAGGSGGFGISAYSYTNNVVYLSEFGTVVAFDASSANHKFLTSFHGVAVANGIVAMDVKDSVFFDAKGGGIEVLKYTPPAGTCNDPVGMTTTNITGSSATFSWSAASGAASYNVRYRVVGTTTWITGTTATTSFNAAGLTANTNYEWQVQSACGGSGGNSSFTASLTFTTAAASGCNTPAGLNARNITRSSAVLSWTAVSGALKYNLQWKVASSGTWTTVPGLTTTSYNLTGLSSHTNYQFKVQAICSSGSSAYSNLASFRTSGFLGLSYIESSNTILNTVDFKLYPNPAGDILTFEFTGVSKGNVKVNVYNLSGQKVMNIVNPSVKGLNTFKLNTSKLGTGFYIFELENNEQRQHGKFLIVK